MKHLHKNHIHQKAVSSCVFHKGYTYLIILASVQFHDCFIGLAYLLGMYQLTIWYSVCAEYLTTRH